MQKLTFEEGDKHYVIAGSTLIINGNTAVNLNDMAWMAGPHAAAVDEALQAFYGAVENMMFTVVRSGIE